MTRSLKTMHGNQKVILPTKECSTNVNRILCADLISILKYYRSSFVKQTTWDFLYTSVIRKL